MEPKPIATDRLHETVLDMFYKESMKKNAAILDAGCGEGALLNELYKRGYTNLHGIDINKDRFLLKDRSDFRETDLNEKLPFKSGGFDFIFSIETLEHIESPYNAIREFHRLLNKGGKLIISAPNLNNWYQKLYFVFTGGFHGFFCREPEIKIHVSPLFLWYMKKLLYGKFDIMELRYHRPIMPFIRVHAPFKNSFFCEGYIIKCVKI